LIWFEAWRLELFMRAIRREFSFSPHYEIELHAYSQMNRSRV